jgi:hypothetical protein
MAARDIGMRARGRRIAVADRQQSLRDRVPAARMAPLAASRSNFLRQPPQRAQDTPRDHSVDDDDAERQRKDRQRGMHPPVVPGQREFARLIGDPRRTGRRECDQEQE